VRPALRLLSGARAVQMASATFTGDFAVIGRGKGLRGRALIGSAADRIGIHQEQLSPPGCWRRFVPPH
jgi:hypothetical protein